MSRYMYFLDLNIRKYLVHRWTRYMYFFYFYSSPEEYWGDDIYYILTRKNRLNYLGWQLKINEIEGFLSSEHSFVGWNYKERGGLKEQDIAMEKSEVVMGTPFFCYVNEFRLQSCSIVLLNILFWTNIAKYTIWDVWLIWMMFVEAKG